MKEFSNISPVGNSIKIRDTNNYSAENVEVEL